MSNRLNQDREAQLQPKRIESCRETLEALGKVIIYLDNTRIDFLNEANKISLWPYSGWWSGKGVGSGRGFKQLLQKLKTLNK